MALKSSLGGSPPVIGALPDRIVDEETLLDIAVTSTDPDSPPAILTATLDAGAPNGASITGSSISPTTFNFRWTPTEEQGPGIYPISIRVSDGVFTSVKGFAITVREANQPPQILDVSSTPNAAMAGQPVLIRVTASDSDLPANPLTYGLSVFSQLTALGCSHGSQPDLDSWS